MNGSKPRLQATVDYEKFELCDFNRDVRKTKRLEASMKRHGYIPSYPLHCLRGSNGKLRIKAGHHRFVVARKLGLPVYYVLGDDTATIHELERATVPWSPADYLESYVRSGDKPAYNAVREYHQRTGIPLGLCVGLLAGETANSGNQLRRFKAGRYELAEDLSHAERVADLVQHCTNEGVAFAKQTLFVQAVSRCLRAREFDPKVFKTRVSANPGSLTNCRNLDSMMENIEEVYNHKTQARNRIPLKFLVDQTMRARIPAKPKETDQQTPCLSR